MRRIFLPGLCLGMLATSSLAAQGVVAKTLPDSVRGRITARTGNDSLTVVYSSVPRGRARIGVTISLAPSATDRYGALVESVLPRGPADVAGIRAGDIIAKVNEVSIGGTSAGSTGMGLSLVGERLIAELSSLQPGKVATLQLRRGEATLSVKVTPDRDETVVTTTIMSPRVADEMIANAFRDFRKDSLRLPMEWRGGTLLLRNDSVRSPLKGFPEDLTGFTRLGVMDTTRGSGMVTMRMKDPVTGAMRDSTITFGKTPLAFGKLDSAMKRMATGRTLSTTDRRAPEEFETMKIRADSTLATVERNMVFLRSSFDALSRLELAPVNKDLGSYFGANEGVLVISISPPGVLMVDGVAVPGDHRQGVTVSRRGVEIGTATATAAAPSPASTASSTILNLKAGDIITAVDGRPVTTPAQLMRILRSYESNDPVKLSVVRQKNRITLQAKMPSE